MKAKQSAETEQFGQATHVLKVNEYSRRSFSDNAIAKFTVRKMRINQQKRGQANNLSNFGKSSNVTASRGKGK